MEVIITFYALQSSLLNVILGELPISDGNMKLNGSVSYYSQIPWIFAGTIRNNILFSETYIPERYAKVVEACALRHDFNILPDGDLTLIGERGVTLSGGQKARIALARYKYLLLDNFSIKNSLTLSLFFFFAGLFIKKRIFTCWTIRYQQSMLALTNKYFKSVL